MKLAVGAESVPVGSYTREVLSGLPPAEEKAILANVRSNEPDVNGVVGKLSQGAVDAGFVYRSDVDATSGKLKAISVPDSLAAQVDYGVAVVKGAKEPEAGQGLHRRPAPRPGQAGPERRGDRPAAALMHRGAGFRRCSCSRWSRCWCSSGCRSRRSSWTSGRASW